MDAPDEMHYRDCGSIGGGWPHPASAHALDELVEAVARIAPKPDGNGEHFVEMVLGGNRHCAWLRGSPRLIAALAEVIARDAKVREIVTEWAADEWANSDDRMGDIASVVEGEMA